jgi:hypothetical protein
MKTSIRYVNTCVKYGNMGIKLGKYQVLAKLEMYNANSEISDMYICMQNIKGSKIETPL